ncbi:MAG: HU family DNA-binding protein [Acidithiobacillus sp.]
MGRIRPVIRSSRVGRNPANGAVLRIPEKRTVQFKAAKPLHDLLNGGGDVA